MKNEKNIEKFTAQHSAEHKIAIEIINTNQIKISAAMNKAVADILNEIGVDLKLQLKSFNLSFSPEPLVYCCTFCSDGICCAPCKLA